ncbi:TPA: Gfo/Idh/MocA family oxidoreductase [bacterium]|mgnify:CR=1 FL=1|nr:Gfo/Idh/MocA family oxidoreductase [bacterium]
MAENVKMAMLGCGGMSGAHGNGLKALWENDIKIFDIVAACDIVEANAKARAEQIAAFQGTMPRIYTDVEDMIKNEPDLQAVDICSVHRAHHILAVPCLEAGINVIIEKPLGITMRACNLIVDSAKQNNRILAVAENYRRSPSHRAVNWAIRQGYIGKPRFFFWQDVGEALGPWGWRDFKDQAGAGWLLDGGVHFTDLFRYHLGCEALEVSAVVRSYMPYRYRKPDTMEDPIDVTVEDTTFATIKFENDIIVQWVTCRAAPGRGFGGHVIHGSEGSIDLGGTVVQRKETIEAGKINEMFMASLDEEQKEKFFPRGITDTVAIELKDFADAILTGSKYEVDGIEGLKDEAICFACLEASWFNQPVEVSKIENCEIEGYQKELNDDLGI